MTRPICVHCGERYGQRHTHEEKVCFPKGERRPPYRGNGVVVRERDPVEAYRQLPSDPNNRFDMGKLEPTGEMVLRREIWDGESWIKPYAPFCKLRCALDYARKAYSGNNVRRARP